jgi:hypothetical protein
MSDRQTYDREPVRPTALRRNPVEVLLEVSEPISQKAGVVNTVPSWSLVNKALPILRAVVVVCDFNRVDHEREPRPTADGSMPPRADAGLDCGAESTELSIAEVVFESEHGGIEFAARHSECAEPVGQGGVQVRQDLRILGEDVRLIGHGIIL